MWGWKYLNQDFLYEEYRVVSLGFKTLIKILTNIKIREVVDWATNKKNKKKKIKRMIKRKKGIAFIQVEL